MYRLSNPQKLIYEMEKYAGGAVAVICGSVLLREKRSANELTHAVHEIFRRNDVLRTRIVERDGQIGQEITDYRESSINTLCFDSKEPFIAYAEEYAKIPVAFDGALCEIQIFFLPEQCGILTKCHHIIGDAWTLTLIASQLCTLLACEELPAFPYSDYLESELDYVRSSRRAKDRSFFLGEFKSFPEAAYLCEKPGDSYEARRSTFHVSADRTALIYSYAREHNTSPFMLFLTAFAIYFSRVKDNAGNFYIGTPVLNRSTFREKHTMGMFINTVPVLAKVDYGKSFAEHLAVMQGEALSALRHQKFHYNDILCAIREECGFTEKLYDVILSYQNAVVAGAGIETTWYHSGVQIESLQIHIDDRDGTGIFRIHLDYRTDKFTGVEIERMYNHILNILLDALSDDTGKPGELKLLSEREKNQLLWDFNDTAADYPRDKCIHTLFEEQTIRTPDKTAVIACDRALTYQELNSEANRIAHGLIGQGVGPGDIVAFALPRDSRLIPTMFGILKAGAAYLPVDPDYPQERIHFMLEDSGAKLFVTEKELPDLLKGGDCRNPGRELSSDSLCYCIYTSGSTGKPKGALLTHRNVGNYVNNDKNNVVHAAIRDEYKTIVSVTTVGFDIFVTESILPLVNGMTVLLANEDQARIQSELDSLLREYPADVLQTTPTKMRALMNDVKKRAYINNLKVIILGGEALDSALVSDIQEITSAHIFNIYGPTETTVWSTITRILSDDNITIGHPIANTQIYIVDKYMSPVPIGVAGELCIAGDGVGAGYLNRPELTAEKFVQNPFGGGKLYKTGDLACWREDGNIVYLGRNDFQVKIRGLRVELGEIESAILSVEGVSQAVVVVRRDGDGRQLICAFYTGRGAAGTDAIKAAIREKLPRYMMPHIFTRLEALPLTPSEKVDRKSLPEVDLSACQSEIEYAAPATESETVLASAVSSVLGLDRVGMLDNFFDLGGDSLKAIELAAALEQAGHRAEIKTIFGAETLRELAAKLAPVETEEESPVPVGDIPATPAQMRVYTAQNMSGGTAYNVPYAFRVKQLDPVRLQAAVDQMVARHEILRTCFENREGQVMQVAEDTASCRVEKLESEDFSAFIRPFDLEKAPLLRVGYFENTVLLDMHHIITDGASLPVFLREMNELYMGRELKNQPVQYREFAAECNAQGEPDYVKTEQYWLSVFADEPPVLELRTDYSRQDRQSYEGKTIYESIDGLLHEKICTKSKSLGITPYAFYMGAFFVLISKFSGNEDIVVGTPASGRSGRFFSTLGMFVNTLPLRGKPEGEKNVENFLREVRTAVVDALENQDYPYGELVKKLGIHSEGRNPLFDVMFAYQSGEMAEAIFGDEPVEVLPVPVATSKYDFTFSIIPKNDGAVLMAEYCTALFREGTIRRFIAGYKLLLSQMLDEGKQIRKLSVITEEEKKTLLRDFNDTAADYPRDKCVHTLFEERAAEMPDRMAVIACDRTLTYEELNSEANRIAHGLIGQGVRPGDIVAFALSRDSRLIPAMFGILKAGAAYLPVDPDYPQERIRFMLKDSGAKLFVTEKELPDLLAGGDCRNPDLSLSGGSLYCVLHTSGSTGTPKLSTLTHHGIRNFFVGSVHWYKNLQSVCALTIFTFDAFILETVIPLLHGITVALACEEEIYNQSSLEALLEKNPQTLVFATPTKLKQYMEGTLQKGIWRNVVRFIIGGEVFTEELLSLLQESNRDAEIVNIYGPTETTICVATMVVKTADITIGRPIANTQIYIVDKYMNTVPIGVAGELCIAGDGVGAGYLNRPELTAEKFVQNPFGEGKLYKTGDLACWREDGNIVYLGRNDFQVKIRGLRIELGEIESAISSVEGVGQAAVVVRRDGGGRQLICAFYTGRGTVETEAIKAVIREKLPRYMMPHIFTRLEALPLTPSGKVDRKSLPEVDLSACQSEVEYAAPATESETVLASAMSSVLGLDRAGMLDNFFDLGGDSLKAIELAAALEQAGYRAEIKIIFGAKTLRELAAKLVPAETGEESPVSVGDIPATPAQMRVYTAQNMSGGTAYNVPYAFRVTQLDPVRLQAAVDQMAARHEILRTRFEKRDGQVIQVVEDTVSCRVEKLESGDLSAFIRPFDLEKAPLLRVGHFENSVLLDMHHIITDGASLPVFLREMNELYMGRKLKNQPVQYREFAAGEPDYAEAGQYWLSIYAEEPPVLELNTDYPRPDSRSYEGAAVYESIGRRLHEKIRAKSKSLGITPYAFYLGAFFVLLSRFSGSEDIVVGTPASGRSGRFLNALGMFVNTLALRGRPEGEKSVVDFLKEVGTTAVEALENQNYPYGELVKKLGIHSEGRNPLFDVMFAYQSGEMTEVVFGDEPAEVLPVPVATSKYDFTFNIIPTNNDVVLMVEYCTALFKEGTIRRFIAGYKLLLSQMLDAGKQIRELSAITEDERETLLRDFNDTAADYPRDKCVHTLFEEQAAETPDRTAVIACDRALTYRELNSEANRIAHGLIGQGVRPGDIVAFALPRDSRLIPAVFGILKAGAAYMPIDPDYPPERIRFMLEDSGAKLFVTEKELLDLSADGDCRNPGLELCSDSLCYCIYTSGSTGRPKGVAITHRNAVNFCCNDNSVFHQSFKACCDCVLATNNVVFDITMQEIHLPLLNGKQVFLMKSDVVVEKEEVGRLDISCDNPALITTPTKISLLLDDEALAPVFKKCQVIMVGAEKFAPALYRKIRKRTDSKVLNGYGPTETTCGSCYQEVASEDISIGRPIANTQIYIVDRYMNPVPIGVAGELCIAGDGVGAGYLNRPELTAEKFVQNPFGEGKLYKTGDLACWREDGNIVYLGRNDFQVKIRGLRIELGEIESAISSVEDVGQSAVVVRRDGDGRQLICAFYTGNVTAMTDTIKAAIRERLPRYMMPNIFTRLEALPLTPSGKVDRKSLPEVDLAGCQANMEYVPPQGQMEKELAAIMEQLLDYSPIGRDDDFFDLGGDSLRAIEFVTKAHTEGIYFTLQNVFDHPTVGALRKCIETGDKPAVSYQDADFASVNTVLAKNRAEINGVPDKIEIENLLLTGATGFLGIHVLADYLENDSGTAYCLVRGQDQADSEKRLEDLLQFYFGEKYICLLGSRIQVLCGDLQKEHFGLSEQDYKMLLDKTDTVINTAATVKHYGSYKFFHEVNVESVERLIRFCRQGWAKLIHVSTLSVSGNGFDTFDGYVSPEEKHFYEDTLYFSQPLDNVYSRSKFEAEKLVLEAVADGLNACIMRMGNLTNRTSDGVFQINHETNAAARRIKAMLELGAVPDYLIDEDMYVEFTPVDEAAGAVLLLTRYFDPERTVFHINSTKVVYLDRLMEIFAALGYPSRAVSGGKFIEALRETAKRSGMEHIFETFINDLDKNDRLNYDSNIRIENDFTVEYLGRLGFTWGEIGAEYFRKYAAYFEKIRYWRKV